MVRKIRLKSFEFYKLDIGCKTLKKKEYVGVDIKDFGQEIVWDVTQGIPLPDNSTSHIYMSHFLEHIEDKYIRGLFAEIYRICIDGAKIEIIVPHSDTSDSYRLSHVSFWNEKRIKGIVGSIKDRFEIVKIERKGIELKTILKLNK